MLRPYQLLMASLVIAVPAGAQSADTVRVAYSAARCSRCAKWNQPHAPFRIFANTWYVGTDGLSSILITSPRGHILIDGALAMSAPLIVANIQALGFRIEDVKLLLNSHDHSDHAGGLAELARLSGARVAASARSAPTLERGQSDPSDPQYGVVLPYPPVHVDQIVHDGQKLHVGPLTITAHLTPGHTPGGTSWSWRSCDTTSGPVGQLRGQPPLRSGQGHCVDIVYVDSQSPASDDDFLYTRSTAYPNAIQDFEHGLALLDHLPCDILLTPHPEASDFWHRIALRDSGDTSALIDRSAMAKFVANARNDVAQRVLREEKGRVAP
ncbi:MAG TPA: subclass B3 metallo-beta-lactamase [Gemmatimonadales bacterium]|jgi:metallo-beta-lactamase class B